MAEGSGKRSAVGRCQVSPCRRQYLLGTTAQRRNRQRDTEQQKDGSERFQHAAPQGFGLGSVSRGITVSPRLEQPYPRQTRTAAVHRAEVDRAHSRRSAVASRYVRHVVHSSPPSGSGVRFVIRSLSRQSYGYFHIPASFDAGSFIVKAYACELDPDRAISAGDAGASGVDDHGSRPDRLTIVYGRT